MRFLNFNLFRIFYNFLVCFYCHSPPIFLYLHFFSTFIFSRLSCAFFSFKSRPSNSPDFHVSVYHPFSFFHGHCTFPSQLLGSYYSFPYATENGRRVFIWRVPRVSIFFSSSGLNFISVNIWRRSLVNLIIVFESVKAIDGSSFSHSFCLFFLSSLLSSLMSIVTLSFLFF